MPGSAIIFDVEFLVSDGARQRFWCGPYDPDPIVVQVGAVKLNLSEPFDLGDRFMEIIEPKDRSGRPVALDPLFIRLTGLSEERVAQDGKPLADVLDALAEFAADATLWSWGKDEMNMMAISCYVAGIAPVIPAARFGNACVAMLAAGMPYEDMKTTRSSDLCAYLGLKEPEGAAHDALFDAMSLARTLQHELRGGRLPPDDLRQPKRP